ncbi:MAG: NERD domain-containing protein [Opitutus sp.]|nr:NERD domain-containing protein [Opitutus sp.]
MNFLETAARGFVWPIVVGTLFLLPLLVLAAMLHRMKKAYRAMAAEPFTQLPLRPPGESLRLAIEKMSEDFDDHFLTVAATGGIACVVTMIAPPAQRLSLGLVMFAATALVTFWKGRKLKVLIRRLWDFRLGFMGERVVGEELNQLLASGFRVFHDIPFDGFNVDHVLVGPPGVYAVETKARRKPSDVKGVEKAKVTFDGETLTYPQGYVDRRALEQARRNARTLEEWLTKACGERVMANAILTLPGWWVDRRAVGDVNVLNPEEIKRSFPNRPKQPLSASQIERIGYQLSERCRLPPTAKM